ncbi:unnamed protein product [Arctia plantaginis]|uniref:Tetraspanin n=1 Tax=Arctia plantaginis TaxID=874455 RepID=A0A8S1B918_ARCPL|nr:unnamed protein product [Arctia plantaginis]
MGVFILKCVLHFFNFIIMLTGMAPLICGILTQLGYMDVGLTNLSIEHVPPYMMVVGSVIIIISIVGCCGGLMEHAVMLIFYSVFMAILMAGSILLAVTILLKIDYLLNLLTLNITTQFHKDVDMFSQFEVLYLCCGTHGAISYQSKGLGLSNSCCATPPCTFDKVTFPGCVEKTQTDVMNIRWIFAGTVIGLAVTQLFQTVVSSYLAFSVRKKQFKMQYS